jgi:hypothetical protein
MMGDMNEIADSNRADALRAEDDLAASIHRMRNATAGVQPKVTFLGETPAAVLQSAADWADENPDFIIVDTVWSDDASSAPQFGITLLIDTIK